ncbi:preprotein translocase subunit SecG [Spirochaetia bacterium 38H-sp]|uniref:Protein-export membrane protein SecG n=1 Tax=Rarispira pelagica TaxID=3141764 RepID=A0ABU9UE37_9SPIR
MAILGIFFIVLLVISALLLILIVLVQDEQGEGLGGIFGGGSASQVFGVQSENVLTKTTRVLALIFFLSVIGIAWVYSSGSTDITSDSVINTATQEQLKENPSWWEEENTSSDNSQGQDTAADTEQPAASTDKVE